MVVPSGQPASFMSVISPPSSSTRQPSEEPLRQVVRTILETEDMAARASPRKPIVEMLSSPLAEESFDVAWRVKARPASSGDMPQPLSITLMKVEPPFFISTVIELAPASMEFSMSSLMTEAGRSTTSPAAIISASCGDSILITDIGAP